MKRLFTIRWKLTLSYAALIVLVVLAISAFNYRLIGIRLQNSINQNLDDFADGLWVHMYFHGDRPTLDEEQNDYFVRMAGRYYQLYDADTGEMLSESEDSRLLHLAISPEAARKIKLSKTEEKEQSDAKVRFRTAIFRTPGGHEYLLRVGMSLVQAQALRAQALESTFITVPLVLALAGISTWWVAGRVLRPIDDLRETAHRIGISHLNLRLPLRGTGDELDRLAVTFNDVFSRLEGAVQDMKQFTASMSHELRTPLAVLQGETETALMDPETSPYCRRVLASQLEEFHKLSRLVSRLLELARAEAGEIQLSQRNFDVVALVRNLGEQMQPLATCADVDLAAPAGDPIQIVGDPQWIERAILNLVDNAIKFTPAGGSVLVTANLEDRSAEIQVSDTGIGIPEESLPHIFTRFYQADSSRSRQKEGLGLGLAIAYWIVEAHHGSIKVTSEPGSGTCFTVLLPAQLPPE